MSTNGALDLEMDCSKEEVWGAVNELENEKAPGSYGFEIAFLQHCWSIGKGDIMGFFADFMREVLSEKAEMPLL